MSARHVSSCNSEVHILGPHSALVGDQALCLDAYCIPAAQLAVGGAPESVHALATMVQRRQLETQEPGESFCVNAVRIQNVLPFIRGR